MPGECTQKGVIYEAVITTDDGRKESYMGSAKNVKPIFLKHRATLNKEDHESHTTLSNYVWRQKNMDKEAKISWQDLEKKCSRFQPCDPKMQTVH